MRTNISIDEKTTNALKELVKLLRLSKSDLIRKSVEDFYLKEKRAESNLDFFIDAYNKHLIDKNTLYILLPKNDAENIIIGSYFGKKAAQFVKNIRN